MTDADRKEFSTILYGIYALYRADLSEPAVSLWWAALRRYELEAVADALTRHMGNPDNGQFLPKPADVVRMVEGSSQDSGLLAWTEVDRKVREFGGWRSVVFDDPIIMAVINDMGGWAEFGICDEERDWPFRRKEFIERYRAYRIRGTAPELEYLAGRAETVNRSRGLEKWADAQLPEPIRKRLGVKE